MCRRVFRTLADRRVCRPRDPPECPLSFFCNFASRPPSPALCLLPTLSVQPPGGCWAAQLAGSVRLFFSLLLFPSLLLYIAFLGRAAALCGDPGDLSSLFFPPTSPCWTAIISE